MQVFNGVSWLSPVLLSLIFWTTASVAAPAQAQDVADTESSALLQLVQVDQQLGEILALSALHDQDNNPDNKSGEVSQDSISQHRLNERALELLKRLVALTEQASASTADNHAQQELIEALEVRYAQQDVYFIDRIEALKRAATALANASERLSGTEAVLRQVLYLTVSEQRLRILELNIDLIAARQKININTDDLRDAVTRSVTAYAEVLMGDVQFRSRLRTSLLEQQRIVTDNAEIISALQLQSQRIQWASQQLQRVAKLMTRLELDSSSVRAVLLKQSGPVSVSMLDGQVLDGVVREVIASLQKWLRENAVDALVSLLLLLGILVITRIIARFTRAAVRRALESRGSRVSVLLRDVAVSISGGVVITVGVLVALHQVGISLAPMLAGLGVAGFIIGFALQDTLGNFAAGAMILAYRPFDTDDFIEVAGVQGTVKNMNIVSTTITTSDNKLLVVPNSKIWGSVINNYTGQHARRVDLVFGISYSADIERAEAILKELVDECPTVLPSPEPIIRLHHLGESSVDFICRPWVKTADYWDTHWRLTKAVKLRFDAEGIEIPFPQRDVHHHFPEGRAPA